MSHLSDRSDEELMVSFQKGTEEAFDELVSRYGRKLTNLVFRYVRDRETAYDLVQEVLLSVVRRSAQYDRSRGRFVTWLYAIARSLCLNELKRIRSRPRTVPPGDGDEGSFLQQLADSGEAPPERLLSLEERDRLAQALDRLRPEFREVVLLRVYDGLSFREIAEVVGAPETTVKSRMTYAVSHLRRALH